MAQGRSSLLSDTDMDSIGSKGSSSKKGGMDTMTLVKLGGGAVALLVGVFLILRSMGMFGGGPSYPKIAEPEAARIEEAREQERKQLEIETNSTVAGS